MLFPYRLQLCYRMWSISNVEAVKSLPPFLDVRWLTSAKPHHSLVLLCASLLGKLISTRCWWDIHNVQAHEPHRAPPPSSSPTITIKIPSQSLFLSLSSHFSDQLGKCVFFPKHLILWLRNFFIHFRGVCVCACVHVLSSVLTSEQSFAWLRGPSWFSEHPWQSAMLWFLKFIVIYTGKKGRKERWKERKGGRGNRRKEGKQ